jgi:hypothetical protein
VFDGIILPKTCVGRRPPARFQRGVAGISAQVFRFAQHAGILGKAKDLYTAFVNDIALPYAVFKDRLSGEPIVDGVAQNGVASIELSGKGVSMIEFIIKGEEAQWNKAHPTLDGKTTKDRELYMVGFAKGDDGITYFEMNTFASNIASVNAITYTNLLANSME